MKSTPRKRGELEKKLCNLIQFDLISDATQVRVIKLSMAEVVEVNTREEGGSVNHISSIGGTVNNIS